MKRARYSSANSPTWHDNSRFSLSLPATSLLYIARFVFSKRIISLNLCLNITKVVLARLNRLGFRQLWRNEVRAREMPIPLRETPISFSLYTVQTRATILLRDKLYVFLLCRTCLHFHARKTARRHLLPTPPPLQIKFYNVPYKLRYGSAIHRSNLYL